MYLLAKIGSDTAQHEKILPKFRQMFGKFGLCDLWAAGRCSALDRSGTAGRGLKLWPRLQPQFRIMSEKLRGNSPACLKFSPYASCRLLFSSSQQYKIIQSSCDWRKLGIDYLPPGHHSPNEKEAMATSPPPEANRSTRAWPNLIKFATI